MSNVKTAMDTSNEESQLSYNASTSSSCAAGKEHATTPPITPIGSPTALGMGAFAIAFTTLSMSLMEWRGAAITNAYIGNCFFTAGLGLVLVAQWELVRGNSYGHTVFGGFGLFNLAFGAINAPAFGVADAFKDDPAALSNALGYFLLVWGVFVLFFTIAAMPMNLVYTAMLGTSQITYTLLAASYFAMADEKATAGVGLKKAAGAFGFVSGLLAWYVVAHLMCQDALFFSFPLGDTSRLYARLRRNR
ncbi:putative Acetate transporter [Aspergillus clavatus NRRL 1]|uniref:Acetate transporter protein patA n=1 Tax=Aspergillus clavatus (strain ATCC 1007 / CBS 513.65 / DSM 816 / NCTC 3887 / NRRL 1 / QM 1276 / 107) TaxID=344612 RepID=PATA_ASPCL|nr:Acetate transporter, putative [Aspergillus clavatus NRRL 1]A1CFK8.1 RecName: Full=Acetate transporter protein patA; AltName: Full=Patulin synthesis protein A [Aspergillus clavatus NRRL 1]EAW11657.1 Acetate transporter, putative [Aspergillus clavatus NRRL 1]